MKLLLCVKCLDIFNLTLKEKTCTCGESSGKYINQINAEIKGNCKVLGFHNNSFANAFKIHESKKDSPSCCEGTEFKAFFIPENSKGFDRI